MGTLKTIKNILSANRAINELPSDVAKYLDGRLMNGKKASKLRQAVGLEDADGFMTQEAPGTLHRAASVMLHSDGSLAKGRIAGVSAGLGLGAYGVLSDDD